MTISEAGALRTRRPRSSSGPGKGEPAMARMRRILHPTDFSRASAAAFAKAVELAKANRAELALVHVIAPVVPMVGDGYVAPQLYEELETSARAHAQKQL